jgi:hypothetical protein
VESKFFDKQQTNAESSFEPQLSVNILLGPSSFIIVNDRFSKTRSLLTKVLKKSNIKNSAV